MYYEVIYVYTACCVTLRAEILHGLFILHVPTFTIDYKKNELSSRGKF